MRAVTFPGDVDASVFGTTLSAGVEYLLADIVCRVYRGGRRALADWQAAMVKASAKADAQAIANLETLLPLAEARTLAARHSSRDANNNLRLWQHPTDLNGKRLLFLNGMGLGDFLMLTPTAQKIKRLYPGVAIGTACDAAHVPFVKALPCFDEVLVRPNRMAEVMQWDYHVNYEEAFEKDKRANEIAGHFFFAERLNLDLGEDETSFPIHLGRLTPPEWFSDEFPQGKSAGEKWAGIFLRASARCRNWRPDNILVLTHYLLAAGYRVLWLGREADSFAVGCLVQGEDGPQLGGVLRMPLGFFSKQQGKGFVDLCGRFAEPLALSQFVNEYLDVVVTPDSFAWHLCGMIGKPCIGLFGPIPAHLRMTKAYRKGIGLRSDMDCAPCFAHNQQMPCGKEWCDALDRIQPEKVLQWVTRLCPPRERKTVARTQGAAYQMAAAVNARPGEMPNLRVLSEAMR